MIQGVSLDLWDTVIADDSDEPKRRAAGLPSKWDARVDVVARWLGPAVPKERIGEACGAVAAAFRRAWRDEHRTFGVRERLERIVRELGIDVPPGLGNAVTELEEMELDPCPDPVPGALRGVGALSERWPLAIISDTVMSPGRCLREILRANGLLPCFRACVFSDEAGRSKPHREVFVGAAHGLGVPLEAMVHVGDREHNDVGGAHAAGMKAVLFVGARDADREGTRADAVCESWDELPSIIDAL